MEAETRMSEESEQVTPEILEHHLGHAEMLMEQWAAETVIENMVAADPLHISFEETSEGENDSDDWPVPLEIWIDSCCY
ncbi:hypothetical protein B7P43_G02782 [Cryptotermes secundus]|uniref:Uncharacterized protein n=1 Tax=Cryptotermes secundus TaxID=105785 RepID=A0A2J7RSX7_9NEOP|nr:hypothetical protein B7P43_G02782 [Cryptotermes secundus]